MTNHELAAALRMCGQASGADQCESCPFFRGFDAKLCVPKLTAACADALENHETHIAALQKEIEGLRRRVPQWISVEDRLPEDHDDVLVLVSGVYRGITFEDAQMIGVWFGADEGWWLAEFNCWDNPGVTHWMPLPEAPSTETSPTGQKG